MDRHQLIARSKSEVYIYKYIYIYIMAMFIWLTYACIIYYNNLRCNGTKPQFEFRGVLWPLQLKNIADLWLCIIIELNKKTNRSCTLFTSKGDGPCQNVTIRHKFLNKTFEKSKALQCQGTCDHDFEMYTHITRNVCMHNWKGGHVKLQMCICSTYTCIVHKVWFLSLVARNSAQGAMEGLTLRS